MTDVELNRLLNRAIPKFNLIGVSAAIVSGDTTVATSAAGLSDLASGTAMSVGRTHR